MNIQNKLLVNFHLESGCNQEDDEVTISWAPINFQIYSNIFIDLIEIATTDWLSDNELKSEVVYEVIFSHVVERDRAGAVHTEYFEPVLVQHQEL